MAEQLNFWNRLDEADPDPASPPNAKPVRKSTRAMRKCLGPCGKPFMSSGPGNRFCPNCRRHEAFADGAAEYSVQF